MDAAVVGVVVEKVGVDKAAERVGVDEEVPDCACLAWFLAAALVCQPHEHGLFPEGLKK